MPGLASLTRYLILFLLSTIVLGVAVSYVKGQLEIPNITQRMEKPESTVNVEESSDSIIPEELMAMQGIFSVSGQLYGFGFNVNNNSLLCPSNSCEFTLEKGVLRQDSEGRYNLEGNLKAAEKGNSSNIKQYDIDADLGVRGSKDQGSNLTEFLTGFFDVRSNTNSNFVHYYIYNGSLSKHPDELTIILQGKVLPKRT